MIRGVVIEGLSTSGKTSLLSALKRAHCQDGKERSLVVVSEQYTQILHEDHGVLRSLDQRTHIELLNRHVSYLVQLNEWIDSLGVTKAHHGVFFLLERFHLNHRAAFGSSPELWTLERQLLDLNVQCVLLTLSPEVVEQRYIKSRDEAWKSYVMAGSRSTEEVCRTFLSNQEHLLQSASESCVPTTQIITDNADWDEYAWRAMRTVG